jgi:hypothetical protein
VQLPGWDVDTAMAALGIDRVAFNMVNGNAQGFSFEDDVDGKPCTPRLAAEGRKCISDAARSQTEQYRNAIPHAR